MNVYKDCYIDADTCNLERQFYHQRMASGPDDMAAKRHEVDAVTCSSPTPPPPPKSVIKDTSTN